MAHFGVLHLYTPLLLSHRKFTVDKCNTLRSHGLFITYIYIYIYICCTNNRIGYQKTVYRLYFCISVSDRHQDEKSSRYRYMYAFRNTCSCAPNDVYKCIELYFPVLQCCYYCFGVLSAVVVAILPL